jgi:hypothetical protein
MCRLKEDISSFAAFKTLVIIWTSLGLGKPTRVELIVIMPKMFATLPCLYDSITIAGKIFVKFNIC